MQLTEREKQRLYKNICTPYGMNILNLIMTAETVKAYDFCRQADNCRENIIRLNNMRRCCSRDELQEINGQIREERAMIRFWTFCKNVFRDRKRRMSKLFKHGYAVMCGYAVTKDRLGDMSELFASCCDAKGKYRAYETTDIVDAYVKHVASEEQIPYAYVRIRQDARTGKLIIWYGETRLAFDGRQCTGRKKRYLLHAAQDIRGYRLMTLADKKSWPAWRPIISDILVTPAGRFKITAQSWWEMLNCIDRLAAKKVFVTDYSGIYITMAVYRHPVSWG